MWSSSQHCFGLVSLMSTSSRDRENVAISLVFTSRERPLPFCELRERCTPERPKNDQNRARCWLPQHAQQGKKKGLNIIPKCFQNRPRSFQHDAKMPLLSASWRLLAARFLQHGVKLAYLGPSWAHLGASWGDLGAHFAENLPPRCPRDAQERLPDPSRPRF